MQVWSSPLPAQSCPAAWAFLALHKFPSCSLCILGAAKVSSLQPLCVAQLSTSLPAQVDANWAISSFGACYTDVVPPGLLGWAEKPFMVTKYTKTGKVFKRDKQKLILEASKAGELKAYDDSGVSECL